MVLICCNDDKKCRKAENTRNEAADPVKKMFKFFHDMKAQNSNFYFDVHIDEHKTISKQQDPKYGLRGLQ